MEKDSITKSSIADTQLSERVKVALRAIGITDVADLMQTSMPELASRTTLGIQFLREIESFKRSIENRDSDAQKVQMPVKERRSLTKLEAVNDIPVEDLELSARAYNALKLNRILTLGEFLHLDMDSLEHLDYVSHSIAEELYSCAREHLSERRLTRRQEDGETTDWDVKRDQPLSTATQEAMFPAVETTSSLVSDQVFSPSSAEVQEPHPFSAEAAQQIPAQEKPLLTSVQEQLLLPDEAQLQLVTGGKRPVPHAAVIDRIGEAEDKLLDATGDECVNRYSGVASSLADGAKKTEEPSRGEQDAQSNTLECIPSLKNDSRPIEMLSLSVRAYNCLKRAKINTVWELAALTHDELAKLRHLGSKTLAEIEDVLGHLIAGKNPEEDSKAESVVTPIRDLRPIETLGLSERSLFYLNMMEIKTIQALLDYPLDELWKYGPESETEIREAIQTYRSTAKGSPTRQFGENSSNSERLSNGSPIEDIGLSVRSINCLRGAGIKTVQQLLATSAEKLLSIRNLGQKSLTEIETFKANYTPVFAATKVNDFSAGGEEDSGAGKSVLVIRDDRPIEDVGLSVRSYNCLRRAGIMTVQQLLDTSSEELLKIKNLGQKSLTELEEFRKSHVPAVALPPKTEYSVEELKPLVMDAFVTPFRGLSYEEIKAALPDTAEDSSIKRAVGELLCEHKIEYVDFRCYKVYPSFFTYFENHLEDLPPRTRTVLVKRYAGETLETIGKDLGITRERIRQIDKKAKAGYMRALRMACKKETGSTVFDEDFYRDLYTKCDLPESFWTEELGLSEGSIKYLKNTFKAGSKKPEETLNDEDIPVSLRYRVRNFLDRNKVRIDGRLMPRKRSDIEEYALRKYAKEEITFTDFSSLYNGLLEANGIPYDEKLYYTETSLRTRANRFSDSRLCLWKQGERLRYYDIDAGDYSELIETLGLDSYHDTEVSTRKFTNSFPELMKKYDIRDPYELHNLLKKISSRYKLDSVMFNRQPILQFGSFDRTKAITEAMFALAPVTQHELVEYLYLEYGYDKMTAVGYLTSLSQYYHSGVYDVDYQRIPDSRLGRLMQALTEDFYFLDEIKDIYAKLFPGTDTSVINPRSLKVMGFLVNSNYAVQNHSSAEAFFSYLLTKDDIYDVQSFFNRFGSIRMFTQTYYELLINHRIFRFEPDQIITLRRLERLNITLDTIEDFCAAVQDYQDYDSYFTMESLRQDGFAHPLDALGFDDFFYASLLGMDKRFSLQRVFGSFVLFNGATNSRFSIADFIIAQLREYDSVDPDEFIQDITDRYGVVIPNRYEVTMAIKDTELYYDDIMDKIYRDKSLYYADLDE